MFIFAHPVHLQGIRVKFTYEGPQVKVTGDKDVHTRQMTLYRRRLIVGVRTVVLPEAG